MMFPDCRNDEFYNADFLDKNDSECVSGYDWAAEAVDNLFDNLEVITDSSDYVANFMNTEVPDYMQEQYTMEFAFGNREDEDRVVKTYADYLRFKILEWLEDERNEFITSMIDNMDEKMYEAIRNRVLKDNEKKENPKEYYDSRKFICRGVKEMSSPDADADDDADDE